MDAQAVEGADDDEVAGLSAQAGGQSDQVEPVDAVRPRLADKSQAPGDRAVARFTQPEPAFFASHIGHARDAFRDGGADMAASMV